MLLNHDMNIATFEKAILPVKDKLYRFALKLLSSPDDAKDVVQEVLMRVWNNQFNAEEVRNWEAWCMCMTRNLALDRLRASSRKRSDTIEADMRLVNDDLTPDRSAELSDSLETVRLIIDALPDKQRQVMHLRDVEGYSYQEICSILELDMNQVKVTLFRARNTVREKMLKIDAYGL